MRKMHVAVMLFFWFSYFVLNILAAIFYANAFFWKSTTNLCGKVWIVVVAVLMVSLLLSKKQPKISSIITVGCISLISCIQVLAIFFWVVLSDGRHTFIFGSSSYFITPVGALIHAIILFEGLLLLRFSKKKAFK
jgi:hypothetical protein